MFLKRVGRYLTTAKVENKNETLDVARVGRERSQMKTAGNMDD